MVGALLADDHSEVPPYENIYYVSVREQKDGSELEMPEDLENVSDGQVGVGSENR